MPTFSLFNHEPDAVAVPAGRMIFSEGQPGDCMYALLDGQVEIVRDSNVLETVEPGGIFGELALLDRQPRSASAIAKTAVRIAAISEKRFNYLVSRNPPFALEMMRVLVARVRKNLSS